MAVLAATAAEAVAWGPISVYYNNVQRAQGQGDLYNESYVYATNQFWLNDTANDGNNVYGYTRFYYYHGGSWHFHARVDTGEYGYFNTPVTRYLRNGLDRQATTARGESQVCTQMGWPVPDKCSPYAQPTFNY
ncbi:MAG: hypothetical protein ACOYY2_11535 [Actinomycetota bacterium]